MSQESSVIVALVDDDPAVLKALSRLLRSEGWRVEAYESAEAYLARGGAVAPGCLVLDVSMAGLDGLALQDRLSSTPHPPIVFLTGHGDIPMSVRAIKGGAVDFLTKPVKGSQLIAAIQAGLAQARATHAARSERADLEQRLAGLTPRERQVLEGLAAGRLNKQIAGDLGVVEQTVKFHRARIMERMQARTAAELMLLAARLGIGTIPRS